MSKSAQLKRKAAEFEQKRQYDRALATYVQAIEAAAGDPEELDIPLYNRVGDLYFRAGDLDKAVTYYESAVDLYAEGGFFNNAIALCNKVLRHSPGRNVIYYKLGKLSARKGFNSDAKQNFLEYASRMERAGDVAEAFRALKEFADLCPGQDDVRLMLAEQLARAGRNEEAIEQLQLVHSTMVAEDRTAEASAALARIRALDPTFEPTVGRSTRPEKREGLVFIDLDYAPAPEPLSAAKFDEVPLPAPQDEHVEKTLDNAPLAGLTPLEDPMVALAATPAGPGLADFEPTAFESAAGAGAESQPLELEPTSYAAAGSSSVDSNETDRHEDERTRSADQPGAIEAAVTGFVESLSQEVASIEGGLPADLGILPIEAVDEVQRPTPRSDDDFVDLTEWLREGEAPRNPRMTGEDEQQAGHVQDDFSDMLATFKAGVAANVEDSDAESHYDLGVAYMEMGLFDEAVAQFQKVLRTASDSESRVRAYESLGQSFIEKGEYDVALESLDGALHEPGLTDATLVGVLYLLGYASENLGRWREAQSYYRRVFAADIHFRDVAVRLERAEGKT